MLFNSCAFIFGFLPIVLIGFELAGRLHSRKGTLGWLIACSVCFYGIWNPISLAIITPSIAVNYLLARAMQRRIAADAASDSGASRLLAAGVIFNLCFLGYFKYKNFFLDSVNGLFGTHWPLLATVLPLGISFITFQKIAFLVDVRAGKIERFDAFDFLTFVFFFPQLIAGPIVHYREMMPQFGRIAHRLEAVNLAIGISLFAMGLFKKSVFADGIAPYANSVFRVAETGQSAGLVSAWIGALAYTLQIYFDFSGYSDMAIGLARMFGIRLPANFNSPFKSSNIVEFWGRWHITLTRFLTAYVYMPILMRRTRSRVAQRKPLLTRNRRSLGAFLALVAWPTLATMLLSGLWHGAGATFVVWGLVHGLYLVVNHAWRQWRPDWDRARYERVMKPLGFLITFVAVVAAMVLFRAHTFTAAGRLLAAMVGWEGVSLPSAVMARIGPVGSWLAGLGVRVDFHSGSELMWSMLWVASLLFIVLSMPNSLELLGRFEPALGYAPREAHAPRPSALARYLAWPMAVRFSLGWALFYGALLAGGTMSLNRVSEFLYWQF